MRSGNSSGNPGSNLRWSQAPDRVISEVLNDPGYVNLCLANCRFLMSAVAVKPGLAPLTGAIDQGQQALHGDRKSLPSFLMVTRDLTKVLNERYPAETETRDYLDQLATLTALPATGQAA